MCLNVLEGFFSDQVVAFIQLCDIVDAWKVNTMIFTVKNNNLSI